MKKKWNKNGLVVISNQSNGRGTSLVTDFPLNLQSASNYLREYDFATNTLQFVQAGINRSGLQRASDAGLTGPNVCLINELAYLNKNLILVNMTRGGSGIYPYSSSFFNFATLGSNFARDILQQALAFSNDNCTFHIIFSGENESELDNGDPGILGYEGALIQEILDFRNAVREIKGEGHIINTIVMGVHQYAEAIQALTIQAAQKNVARNISNCVYIDTDFVNQVGVHFTVDKYIPIVKKIADAMRNLRKLN